jgi:cytochrome bd ubiquinol oxidase subunit I
VHTLATVLVAAGTSLSAFWILVLNSWMQTPVGINEFPGLHPPVAPLFFAFRIMVGIGMLMLLTSWLAAWQWWRHGEPAPWLTRVLVAMSFSGWLATVAGWYVTEIGRQPFLVYGVLKIADAVAPNIGSGMIVSTLLGYLALYAVLTLSYVTVLFHMARKGSAQSPPTQGGVVPPPALQPSGGE